MTTRCARLAVSVLGLAALVSACAPAEDGGAADQPPPTFTASQDCADTGSGEPTVPLVPLPEDAILTLATRCVFGYEVVAGDGEWLVRTDQQATTGLDGLADALRLPSERPRRNQTCPSVLVVPPILTLTDTAGRQFHPEVPRGVCGYPLARAVAAIEELAWITVATTRVRQTRSELEMSSQCPGRYKAMVAVVGGSGGTQVVAVDRAPRALRACLYDLDPDPAQGGLGADGSWWRSGILADATVLDQAAGAELLTAVAEAPVATPCAADQARFAVVHPLDEGGPWLTIERDGCYRVLVDGEDHLRQLDAALVGRLLG
jgi:hypothetical protein